MNANKTWCKCRFFISDANAFYQDADAKCPYDAHVLLSEMQFTMQMSYAGMKIWSLFMMAPVHVFTRDANVSLQRWRCKCLAMQMPSNGYVMMQMLLVDVSWCKCPFIGMQGCRYPLWVCHDANVLLRICHDANVPLWVCHDANVHVGMSWCKCSCMYVMM